MSGIKRFAVKIGLLLAFGVILLVMYRAYIERVTSGGQQLSMKQTLQQWFGEMDVGVSLPELPSVSLKKDGSTEQGTEGVLYRWQGVDGEMNFSQIPPSDGTPYEEVSMPAVSNTFAPENMPYPRIVKKPPESD